jgi:hypothetical protein
LLKVREETVKMMDNVGNFDNPERAANLRQQYKALIASIDLEISSLETKLVIMHSKTLDEVRIGFATSANVPHIETPTYVIGETKEIDGVNYLKIQEDLIIDEPSGIWVQDFNDIPIMDGTTKKAGSVKVYNNGAPSGNPFWFVVNIDQTGVDPKLIQWKNMIIGKKGETFWNDNFVSNLNISFKTWLLEMSGSQRTTLKNIVSSWDATTIERFVDLELNKLAEFTSNVQKAKAFGFLKMAGSTEAENLYYWTEMVGDFVLYPGLEAKIAANVSDALHWQKLSKVYNNIDDAKAAKFIKEMWLIDESISFNPVQGSGITQVKYSGDIAPTGGDNIADILEDGTLVIDNTPNSGTSAQIGSVSKGGKRAVNCVSGDCGFGPNCFPKGTKVHTPGGYKKIEDIEQGDYVVAYDTEKKDTVHSRVLMPINNLGKAMCRIIAGIDTIVSTYNHKFYLPALKKYLQADSLKAGMKMLTLAGTLAVINNVAAFDSTQQVYNFEVEEYHNYFVGEEGVLVHNDGAWFCFFNYVGITQASGILDNVDDVARIALKDDILNNQVFRDWLRKSENANVLGDRVKAWEKLFHTNIPQAIRTNTTYLSAASKQIENYSSQIAFQFERVLPHVDPNKLDNFFAALDNPKSIDHVRSLAGDFENIPGINLSPYVPNSLPNVDIPAPGTWADPLLHLPGNAAETFTGATATTLSPGQKIYRVLGDGQAPDGGYWTYQLPSSKAELYGGTAVRPEWNAATHYVEYTVPSGGLKVWSGATARQPILKGVDEVNLPGGDSQLFIPDPYRQIGNEFENLPLNPMNW